MDKIAVLDDYNCSISNLKCWTKLDDQFQIDFFSEKKDPSSLSTYEIIVTTRERTIIDENFLRKTSALKHLALTGRLSGQADLEALKKRNISVSYTDGSGSAAAELTIGLILSLAKKIHLNHNGVIEGNWQTGLGMSLSGKTIGIMGLGRIGSKVAQFGQLMNMKVISWGPSKTDIEVSKNGFDRVHLPDLLRTSDIIVVCLRLSDKTRDLLGANELSFLKEGALLINTSRAQIINRDALYSELESGRFFGGFDVFYEEPLPIR